MPDSNTTSNSQAGILRHKAITIAALLLFCIFSVVSWLGAFRYWAVPRSQPGLFDPYASSDLITVFGVALCLLIFLAVVFKSPLRLDRLVFALASVPMILALLRAFMNPAMTQSLVMQMAEALCWTASAGICATTLFSRDRGSDRLRDISDPTQSMLQDEIRRSRQQDRRWKVSLEATFVGAGVGVGFGILAYIFLMFRHQGMGETLFVLVPVSAGFSVGMLTRRKGEAIASAVALTSPLLLLIVFGAEGLLCALLALPILLAGLGVGLGIGVLVRVALLDRVKQRGTTMGALLLVGPLIVVGGGKIERPLLVHPRVEVIRDSVTVNAPPRRVWGNILSIDNIQASRPVLMYVGLPIPERCVLQGQGVGAKRTCYFNSGYIEETITGWNPPYYMGLTINRTHMPGRHWLGFENAEYRLQSSGNSTILTRTTTISSHLLPRWYWRPLERLGVESEHRYILQDVVIRFR